MLKKIKGAFSVPRAVKDASARPTRKTSFAMGKMPFEIWQMIDSYLELHDRASLALTCHIFYNLVGPDVWQGLKTNNYERYKFLIICQDGHYPGHQLCFNCAKFHGGATEVRQTYAATPSSDWCNPSRALRPPHPCPEHAKSPKSAKFPNELVLFDSHQGHVPWWLVQQIMRAHRHGAKFGLSTGILNRTDKKSTGRVTACVNGSRAKIVEDRLLVRVSTVGILDHRSEQPSYDELARNTHTCGHFYRLPAIRKACNAALADFRNPDTKKKAASSTLYRCAFCPTEAQIFIKRAADYELSSARHTYGGSAPGYVIIIERYHDLGEGFYPDDEEWTGLTKAWRNRKEGERRTKAIKARFEGTDRDEKCLQLGKDDGDDAFALNAMMQMAGLDSGGV